VALAPGLSALESPAFLSIIRKVYWLSAPKFLLGILFKILTHPSPRSAAALTPFVFRLNKRRF